MADGAKSGAPAFRTHRTKEGLEYESFRNNLHERLRDDSEFRNKAQKVLSSQFREKTVEPGQVHSNAFMTALSLKYRNDMYIGEQLMPVAPVPKYSDAFPTYDRRDFTAAPDDEMTVRSDPSEINLERGSDTYSLQPYGLKNSLPQATVENQDPAFDEMLDLVENINDALALKRELRCASVLTTSGNYASGNTATLSGSDQWNSSTGGNPVSDILTGAAACWNGGGPGELVGFCSIDVANVLANHPALLDLFKYTSPGLTRMDALAQQLGLARILVGSARKDTANIGQTASYSRIWGKFFGVVRVAARPTLRNASFGYTLRFKGHPLTFQWFDGSKGVSGMHFAKVSFAEQQKVVASASGYLISSAIS